MKIYLGIVIAIIIGGGILFFTQRSSGDATSGSALTFQTVQSDVAAGGQLIDVRTPAEYNAGHINGAINLSLQDIQMGTMPSGTKGQKLYLYCHSGSRASQAFTILKNAGYTDVTNLGAMTQVQAIGGTLTQ